MPEYEMRLRFTAADGLQASRLAEAWAGTCAAEYGTRYAGIELVEDVDARTKLGRYRLFITSDVEVGIECNDCRPLGDVPESLAEAVAWAEQHEAVSHRSVDARKLPHLSLGRQARRGSGQGAC